ncbi:MAG: ribonuclease H-like domain-containing protein [Methanobacterium sp.]
MEYENAYKLREKLLVENQGKTLEDLIKGKEINTPSGSCYGIINNSNLKLNTISSKKAKEKLLSDLKILNGIGESREQRLKEEGFNSIEDLTEHERFGREASKFYNIVCKGDNCEIEEWICNKYPKSHPLTLFSSSFSQHEDFIFLDIETLGFSNRPIILLGLAKVSGENIEVKQYFSRNIGEENAVIDAFLSDVDVESIFVTFNGQTFDMPFIRNRMRYFNLKKDLNHPHFDLLHFSRRQWSEELINCKLTTLEQHLFNIIREDDIPSGLVPEFYQTYLKTDNVGPLIPIIEHNKQDIITLALIFSKLHEEHAHY